jgi:hypothetical protein
MPTRQFALAGTFRSMRRTTTSKSVFPRTLPPPFAAPLLPLELAVPASPALPLDRCRKSTVFQ